MLKNHIIQILNKHLGFDPTASQQVLIDKLSDFIVKPDNSGLFLIKGYAGTGKTTMISAMVKTFRELSIKSVLMAPTGRAAKVMTSYSGESAYTIHKKIYRQRSSKDGFGDFVPDRNLHGSTFFIVDEASMISNTSPDASMFGSGHLLDDLLSYVYNGRNCRLIMVGDTAQLPPVKLDISPALDKQVLNSFGYEVQEVILTDIVRQSIGSGILMNATTIRNQIAERDEKLPKLEVEDYPDIKRIGGDELIEALTTAHDKYGITQNIVVCRSNKRANIFNQGIRNQILWHESEIAPGDLLMVVKNNYFWAGSTEEMDFIANGDIVEIMRIVKYPYELFGMRFADVVVRFIDYTRELEMEVKILLDTLSVNTSSLPSEKNKELFYAVMEDFQHLKTRKAQYEAVKKDPFFNALQVKFAYAVTCHKAQGGQWKSVFVDQGYLTDDMVNVEYLRWLYTAFTRATEELYLVNFKKEFF